MRKVYNVVDDNCIIINDQRYTRQNIIDLYITDNKSVVQISTILNISYTSVQRLLSDLNITKDKKLSAILSEHTCMGKYGTKTYTQTKEYKDKLKRIYQEKYHCDHSSQCQAVKDKYKNTCIVKYGVETTAVLPDVIVKRRNTCIKKYGCENPMQSESVKTTLKNSMLSKYGAENYAKSLWNIESLHVFDSRENLIKFIQDNFFHIPYTSELAQKIGCSLCVLDKYIYKFDVGEYVLQNFHISQIENNIFSFMNSLCRNIVKNDRSVLDGQEIDIYCPDQRIGIEFNGTYWHSDMYKSKRYHFDKSIIAEQKGIRLIHIYEYEWSDPVKQQILKSMLKIAFNKINNKIYARKCIIKEITNIEAKPFNDQNHLQGHRNAQITYGLFYKDKLVQLMSFSKTKYNKNLKSDNEWEIIRGCPGSNNVVVGGVSKLFKHFVKQHQPKKVFSYCDFNKFNGKGYEAIGMKFVGYTGPDMKWIVNGDVINRCPNKHKELKERAQSKIYGAGSKKYIWFKKENK